MLSRRLGLRLIFFGGMAGLFSGHTPYRQWIVYRSERLMIVASRKEAPAFPLAKSLARNLSRTIPDARAEAARAPTIRHVTRLVLSKQIPVAIMTQTQALEMIQGTGKGKAEGPVPLRLPAFLRDRLVLVSHGDFPRDKAYLMLFGLFDEQANPKLLAPQASTPDRFLLHSTKFSVPLHVGAREFLLEAIRPPAKP